MTRIFAVVLCLVVGTTLVAVSPATAASQDRTGFFIGLGAGWGNMGADLESFATDRENSVAGNFRLGWAVTNSVAIGLETSTWAKKYAIGGTGTDLNLLATVTTFAVTVFPGNMGLYARGGLGFATARQELQGGGVSVSNTENGLGLLAAVGYEWRLTKKFALGPQAQWAYLNIGDQGINSADFVSLTAQATWYW